MYINAAFKTKHFNAVTAVENEESRCICLYSELLLFTIF